LLSHILYPLDGVPSIPVSRNFKRVVLISPWVSFDTVSSQSIRRNKYKDTLAVEVLDEWPSAYRGNAPEDRVVYLKPLNAEPEWWRNVPVQEFLVVAGADEIFVDDICKFAKRLKVCFFYPSDDAT
jgi:acetyl esterase/lipase